MWDANHNPADYGENLGRGMFFSWIRFNNWDSLCVLATACEVLARRIVHLAEPEKIKNIMSNRYLHRQVDGDESEMSSALELAIDQHWYNFFSVKGQAHVLMSIFCYFKYHILVLQWSARRCVQLLRPVEMKRFTVSLQSSMPCGRVTWSKLITRIMTLNVSSGLSYIPRSSHSTWYEDVPYSDTRERTFLSHLNPSRLSVPKFVLFLRSNS